MTKKLQKKENQKLKNKYMITKDVLYGWVFTYNPHIKKYMAAPREYARELFNGDEGHVLTSSSMQTLELIIMKTNGDKTKLNKLVSSDKTIN